MKVCPRCDYNNKDTQMFCEECQYRFFFEKTITYENRVKSSQGRSSQSDEAFGKVIAWIGSFALGIILVSRFPRKSPEFMIGLTFFNFCIAGLVHYFREQSAEEEKTMKAVENIFLILAMIFMFIALIFECSSN